MAASPRFKVYNEGGKYLASCHHADDAAALVALRGGTVRDGHLRKSIIWTEGAEEFPASESYDGAAAVMWDRITGRTEG